MEFGLLGNLTVTDVAQSLHVPPGNQRSTLAALLLSANQPVSISHLIEVIWPVPPTSARVTVQNYIKRLRAALGEAGRSRLTTCATGYMLCAAEDDVDVARFRHRADAGLAQARAESWEKAAASLRAALALWRGPALADVPSQLLAETHGLALEEMRLQVLETRIEADLRLGHDREVIPELQLLVSANPLRERPYALLIRAFYGTGQRSAALAAYRTVRDNLVAELACEPGPMLQALHQHILRSDTDIPWDWPGDRARQLRLSLSLIG